ncbi:glycosyltransferase [Neptunomonas marina]|nr:glycosyltransferase [Neptunomonas marina]
MSANPTVAVLLAAFEGEVWIAEQVSSILDQQDVQVALYISVDPGQDGTLSWCQQLAERDSRVTLLPQQRAGSAAANFLRLIRDVPAETADYVSFADQDDIWRPDKLIAGIKLLQISNASGYSSDVDAFWPDGRQQRIVKSQPQREYDYLCESPGPGCTFVLTKALYTALQGFVAQHQSALNTLHFHDWLIYAFARASGYQWVIDSESYMAYRQHANNEQGANVGVLHKLKRFKALLGGRWFGQMQLLAKLLADRDPAAQQVADAFARGRMGYWTLFCWAPKLRRAKFEQWVWAFACLLTVLLGPPRS